MQIILRIIVYSKRVNLSSYLYKIIMNTTTTISIVFLVRQNYSQLIKDEAISTFVCYHQLPA